MVEMLVGIYGLICWLVFVKFKLVPVTTYTVCTAILIGVVILLVLFIALSIFHPVAHDGRMYAPVVQIVPQVRGIVIDVPVEANKPMKKGDVLFRINPAPFQFEVDRLRASLVSKNSKFAQLADELAGAEAATKQARANLTVSESVNDRQLRESYERAKSQTLQVKERMELAQQSYDRAKESKAKNVISQAEFDRTEAQYQSVKQELSQAQTDEKIAAEQLKSGSATLEAARQKLAELEANERRIRTEFNTQIDGQNPDVRETAAQLE